MNYLFDHLSNVTDLLRQVPLGLIIDVDGTIAEIAASPDVARVDPDCKRYLRAISASLPLVAAVSGRSARDARRLVGIPTMVYVGNHGMETYHRRKVVVEPSVEAFRKPIEEALRQLARILAEPGVLVEDKGTTASIHYRLAANPESSRQFIVMEAAKVAAKVGLQVTEGRMVVEIRPPVDIDKGTAVMKLVETHRLASVLYVGDDITDVDAFVALRSWREHGPGSSVSVAVANEEAGDGFAKEADNYLNGVEDVKRFLAWLSARVTRPT